jgi:peptide/nickel transport system substrate-binding protein
MSSTFLPGASRNRLTLTGLAAATAIVLAACGSSGGSSSGAGSADSGKPVSGGTLHVDLSAAPDCLDPAVAISADERAVVRPLADSLVSMSAKGAIEPWLAKSWTVNKNATVYTFHLRPGMTFSDDTPVDATAVKDTFDYLVKNLEATSPRGRGYLIAYKETKVINPLTAEVIFSAPSVQFLAGASTTTLAILSAGSAQKTPDQRCAGDFTGSGPFTLTSYTQGQSATETRRSGYDWAPATATHDGSAYLDALDFQVVDTSNARDGALESGQTDVALDIATQDVPALKAADVRPIFGTQSGVPAAFVVNTTRPGLNDLTVRKAMMIGFNRAADVKAVLGDYYTPATSIFTRNLPVYKNESAAMAYNPAAARKLLQKAGWMPGPGGIREKNGVKLSFSVIYSEAFGAYYTSLLQLFQQDMKAIGIGITLNDLTGAAQVAAGLGHDFDLDITSLTDSDPDIVRSTLALGLFPDAAALKTTGLVALLAQSDAEPVPAQRAATYAKIQDIMIDDAFVIPFWEGGQFVGYTSNVHGLEMDFQSWLVFYDTWLSS